MNEAIDQVETLDQLVRLWAHEGLRLFHDRLVEDEEQQWCVDLIDRVAKTRFPGISDQCLKKPIFYSRYLTKEYQSVEP